jgi:hypothetical protein
VAQRERVRLLRAQVTARGMVTASGARFIINRGLQPATPSNSLLVRLHRGACRRRHACSVRARISADRRPIRPRLGGRLSPSASWMRMLNPVLSARGS